jgi:hypothetical protein
MRSPLRPLAALLLCLLSLAGCAFGGSGSDDDTVAPRPRPSPTPTVVPGGLGPEFFGVHDSDPVRDSWPKAPVGALRVWDNGVAWNQVETAPGVYDWKHLDKIVRTAREHHAAPLIVLGQTPVFHASKPTKVGSYGPGASSMPDLAAWTAYVRAVVKRYNAPDVAFQVWNEANVDGYWSGTPQQMAQLTAAAREVVDAATPVPALVAPALAVRLTSQRGWLRRFYEQRVDGVPVADLTDVLSLQLYPEAGAGPERAPELLADARETLDLVGVPADKPIWDTEINYGLRGGEPATPASPKRQRANVATTYLLNAGSGIGRVYWYSWDLHTIADTDMVKADNDTLSAGGEAFTEVQRWLLGSTVDSCTQADKVQTCTLTTPRGPARVYWSPGGQGTVSTGFAARAAEELGQPASPLPLGGTTMQVGELPVLVTTTPVAAPRPPLR